MVGNGLSTSPSTVPPTQRAAFPLVTIGDNVRLQARHTSRQAVAPLAATTAFALFTAFRTALTLRLSSPSLHQHALVTRHLGIQSLALVYGYSMGAMQALHWSALYPALVPRVAATCGTATCHQYNAVFLEGLLAILGEAGDGEKQPNMGAFGRVYAGWGLPDSWYRQQLWRQHGGHASLDAFLRDSWEGWTTRAVPDDMRCQLHTWRHGALTTQQLGGITARVVYLPSPGDRYFNLQDVTEEAACVPRSSIVPLSTDWGHRAGDPHRPGQEGDFEVVRAAVHQLLRT